MSTRIIVTIVGGALAAVLLVAGSIAAAGKPLEKSQSRAKLEKRALFGVLTGRKEVDANGRKGAGDANGGGSFTATVDGSQLCFGITVKDIDEPNAAHIHRAGPTKNGPIVVPLTPPPSDVPGASGGCATVAAGLSRAILRNPSKFYANVHTAAYTDGAVRGQLFHRPR